LPKKKSFLVAVRDLMMTVTQYWTKIRSSSQITNIRDHAQCLKGAKKLLCPYAMQPFTHPEITKVTTDASTLNVQSKLEQM
jgi:hypothetical protein